MTPTAALEILLNLPLIDIVMESSAAKSATRLAALGVYFTRSFVHSSLSTGFMDKIDYVPSSFICEREFQVTLREGG